MAVFVSPTPGIIPQKYSFIFYTVIQVKMNAVVYLMLVFPSRLPVHKELYLPYKYCIPKCLAWRREFINIYSMSKYNVGIRYDIQILIDMKSNTGPFKFVLWIVQLT